MSVDDQLKTTDIAATSSRFTCNRTQRNQKKKNAEINSNTSETYQRLHPFTYNIWINQNITHNAYHANV